jgi:DNA sulfur modification protein DndD
MKFLRLRLTNIGAFYGNYDFDLNTCDAEKNVVLFGGQNGSGKTTILESIRLALFGPLAYGLKTESTVYLEIIESRLNNIARSRGENTYRVILDIELTEHLEVTKYTIQRSWKRSRSGIKEYLSVQRNGFLLNERETELFLEKLREEYPPHLLELCLFDGEQISQVVTNDTLPSYLQNAARVLFNLDLFENLESDLRTLVKQESFHQDLSDEEKELQHLLEREQMLDSELADLYERKRYYAVAAEEKKALLGQLNKQFQVYGGLKKEQRDQLLSQMQEIERERLLMMEDVKNFVTNLLPFFLVKDLLNDVQQQMHREEQLELYEKVSNLVTTESITRSLSTLQELNVLQLLDPPAVIAQLLLERLLPSIDTQVERIHNASSLQKSEIVSLVQKLKSVDPDKIRESFKKNNELIKLLQQLRSTLEESDGSDDIRNLLSEIHATEKEIEHIQDQQQRVEAEIQAKILERDELVSKKNQLHSKIVRARKARNIFSIVQRVQSLSSEFRNIQLVKKLKEVETAVACMLRDLFRKEYFVSHVAIDPGTFQLRLFDDSNREINKERLSAGEKHILLLATVWAMIRCSKRRMPFVFDTLLGRLDQRHKQSIINNLIPRCGEQVIVLSTDSEIDAEHFAMIQPRVAKAYTIDYDVKQSCVQVLHDTYFTLPLGTEVAK